MKNNTNQLSSKAQLLNILREKQGENISGTKLANELGVSRVAVWKIVQSLTQAGYSIDTGEAGYSINPKHEKDFLYPWEFSGMEKYFNHYNNTTSTMDRAREAAFRGVESGSVFTAEKQSAGRGRNGRTWVSRQGGLFFTILEKPNLAVADYTLFSLIIQIAAAKSLTSICGKKAALRWPNDVYMDNRKIAGITTEISAEGDLIKWLSAGIGINVNNPAPSAKAACCCEILHRKISRHDVLIKILEEIETMKNKFTSTAAYSQGNRTLAAEWNSLAGCIGARAVVFEPEQKDENSLDKPCKIYSRGIFEGIDPKGRCILKTDDTTLYFDQGVVSLAFLGSF
ncbi:MAG: biotin--[acetyl-CoA-carboxylase] ligase [Treponema sp.]|nr:biotin--[acetyl-CoA-carboxylase] ligase [Treponema sp.]